jgi:(S)-2-hydroxyglutarate dehydrogenase
MKLIRSNGEQKFDYLIIGAGIIGLTIARELHCRYPGERIGIIEKEEDVAQHSSGRNSGVLHAGFYYTSDSLKAKFTVDGNRAMRAYCKDNQLAINECGKVVVAKNAAETDGLEILFNRGRQNGVELERVNLKELERIEPNAKSYNYALYSPSTATVDPLEIMRCLKNELVASGVCLFLNEKYSKHIGPDAFLTESGRRYESKKVINCAGLYADQIARDFGFSKSYTILPFKGIYLKYSKTDKPISVNIYPVPNLKNPFLGVHYTVTVDNDIKIGPTAIPAFWRENYRGFSRFSPAEAVGITAREAYLLLKNSFNFRALAYQEMKKYWKPAFAKMAIDLVHSIDVSEFTEWSRPGIRAQLLNIQTNELVQDFVIEGDENSIHILNAVSPAFTCSIPFAEYIVDNYVK